MEDPRYTHPLKGRLRHILTPLAIIDLDDQGNVEFQDSAGNPLPESPARQAKRQQDESIHQWLSEECDKVNQPAERLDTIHPSTPNPVEKPASHPRNYEFLEPQSANISIATP